MIFTFVQVLNELFLLFRAEGCGPRRMRSSRRMSSCANCYLICRAAPSGACAIPYPPLLHLRSTSTPCFFLEWD